MSEAVDRQVGTPGVLAALAANGHTRDVLANWDERVMSGRYAASNVELCLDLTINGRHYNVACVDNKISWNLLHGVLLESGYYARSHVTTIYDLGANIGLAAILLHSLNASAKIVCVEPSPANLVLLKRNLAANDIPSTVIEGAVCARSGRAVLHEYPHAYASHSLYDKGVVRSSNDWIAREIETFRFDDIITETETYGVKIDIEGSEHELIECPGVVANASWIVGELHYGRFVGREVADKLERMLAKYFEVTFHREGKYEDRSGKVFSAFRTNYNAGV